MHGVKSSKKKVYKLRHKDAVPYDRKKEKAFDPDQKWS